MGWDVNLVALESGKELMPPLYFGRCARVQVKVGSNDICGECLVDMGEEVEGEWMVWPDIDSSKRNCKLREEDGEDKVFSRIIEERLRGGGNGSEVGNGDTTTGDRVGIICAMKEVRRHANGMVWLEKGFIK